MAPSTPKSDRPTAIIVTLVFLVVSTFWNMLSDHLFAILLNRPEMNQHSTNIGHWFFIIFSAIMLYWLLRFWEASVAETQESLKKVNRSLRSVSECSRAITRLENEETLMQEICRICVEVGGHRMAWVAFKQDDAQKSLKPAAHWGADNIYLENLKASWSADSDIGQGPAGICIRTGEMVIFQNLLADFRFNPWLKEARKYGYASCIALPLIDNGRTFGALVIFNGIKNAFAPDKTELLAEMAEDLSYGIKTLRMQKIHQEEVQERLMLAAAMDQTSDGIITFDTNATIQYVNFSFLHLCGVPENRCVGTSLHNFECSQRNPEFYRAILKVFATNQPFSGHFINKRSDGSPYDIDAWIAPVFDADGSVIRYVATVRDISQEIVLQRQLRQAQKMEALATLSGGIAHDFNNILAIIITNTEMCLEDADEHDPQRPFLDLILKAGLRGKNLVRQFLTISRKPEQPQKPSNLTHVVEECVSMLRATLPTTIELQQQIPAQLSPVFADPTQIHQVIMNLCTNAADAIAGQNGVLNISLDEITLSVDSRTNYPELPGGNYVRLMVTDNGHGMSREVLDRIFDPFFTTKEQGKGTGLGLSIAHGIVKSHKGHISAVSILEGGTTFTVLLPATTEMVSGGDDSSRAQYTFGKEHILFVDDEADYATSINIVLERCGYQVTARTDSREALDLLRQDSFSCDLLISDQTMPHLTGTQLAAEALKLRPGLPIVLCSGSSPETDPAVSNANVAALGISKLLLKPVSRTELLTTVEQLLTAPGAGIANE
ncbi:ATP-binding protein [Pelovirga terrestris]|uniref:histidine kinase n=1 Tax=Pelovirga terrestris TaxID=2771352 RepID=A0A8J6UHN7_9BACT|nr:ATP-binding protein [Pelovirga terrestris]MBD1401728.1 GAF domain-containing protein [Pelovirga terrestris]